MEKPPLSELAANAAIHAAGQAAEAEAAATGLSQAEADTLLDGAAGLTIKGITFPPLHPAYLFLLGKIDKLAEKEPLLNVCGGKLVSAFLVGRPQEAKALIDTGDAAAFAEAVAAFMAPFTIDDVKRIQSWIVGEFKRLNDPEDEAAKK